MSTSLYGQRRELADTGLQISPVALGCWPLTGMTSLDVNPADSAATLRAAFDSGVNFFDTAYCYGADGESEKYIARELGAYRREIVIATKGGIAWDNNGNRLIDGRPQTLIDQCNESLRRLKTDAVELLYLHAPDPQTPLSESAGALKSLLDAGKTRAVGISNASVKQLEEFQAVCPLSAYQPAYNMLQRQIEADTLPWCRAHNVAVVVYWPLLKGLLAGKLNRDHEFQPGDGRAKYPMFQGEEWQKNQDFLDVLRNIAQQAGRSVAEVAVNWTIHQPGITAALCGAKRAHQIEESAAAMNWRLSEEQHRAIEAALAVRGTPLVQSAV